MLSNSKPQSLVTASLFSGESNTMSVTGISVVVSRWSRFVHEIFVFCFVSTLVKLTTNDNVGKLVNCPLLLGQRSAIFVLLVQNKRT